MAKIKELTAVAKSIVELKALHSDWSLRKIGAELSISGEYVRKVLTAQGISTVATYPKHKCKGCDNEVPLADIWCGQDCKSLALRSILTCNRCGVEFKRRTAEIKLATGGHRKNVIGKSFFCSASCRNEWLKASPPAKNWNLKSGLSLEKAQALGSSLMVTGD